MGASRDKDRPFGWIDDGWLAEGVDPSPDDFPDEGRTPLDDRFAAWDGALAFREGMLIDNPDDLE